MNTPVDVPSLWLGPSAEHDRDGEEDEVWNTIVLR